MLIVGIVKVWCCSGCCSVGWDVVAVCDISVSSGWIFVVFKIGFGFIGILEVSVGSAFFSSIFCIFSNVFIGLFAFAAFTCGGSSLFIVVGITLGIT